MQLVPFADDATPFASRLVLGRRRTPLRLDYDAHSWTLTEVDLIA
jgi:hypothetical protein